MLPFHTGSGIPPPAEIKYILVGLPDAASTKAIRFPSGERTRARGPLWKEQ